MCMGGGLRASDQLPDRAGARRWTTPRACDDVTLHDVQDLHDPERPLTARSPTVRRGWRRTWLVCCSTAKERLDGDELPMFYDDLPYDARRSSAGGSYDWRSATRGERRHQDAAQQDHGDRSQRPRGDRQLQLRRAGSGMRAADEGSGGTQVSIARRTQEDAVPRGDWHHHGNSSRRAVCARGIGGAISVEASHERSCPRSRRRRRAWLDEVRATLALVLAAHPDQSRCRWR